MTRARDASRLITTPPNIYATDSEASTGYLTLSSASSIYRAMSNETTTFRNLVINGDFNVWQRGASFTDLSAGNFYGPDRFGFNRSGDAAGLTISRSTDAPTGFTYSMKNQRTASNTNTAALATYYAAESVDSKRFAGKTFTFSFYAKAGANYSGGALSYAVNSGTGTDQRMYSFTNLTTVLGTVVNLTTSWQRFSGSATFASNINQVGFNFTWTPAGTAGADDSIYITGIQLEEGSLTPFEQLPAEIELALCQRYYEAFTTNGVAMAKDDSNLLMGSVQYRVSKRVSPTLTSDAAVNMPYIGSRSVSALATTADSAGIQINYSGSLGQGFNISGITLRVSAEL